MAPLDGHKNPLFAKDERVLCHHMDLLYEAKVLDVRPAKPDNKKTHWEYLVHYKGWKSTYVHCLSGTFDHQTFL